MNNDVHKVMLCGRTILLCLLSLMMMAGCIVIPIPTGEKPYYSDAIRNLQVGVNCKSGALTESDVQYTRNVSNIAFILPILTKAGS